MPDERIKDLAVTAPYLASDDYDVVDGATNGTRKILSLLKNADRFASRQALLGLLYFDGATFNRRAYWNVGAAASTGMTKWTLDIMFQPTSAASNTSLWEMGTNNSGANTGNVTSCIIRPSSVYRLSMADGLGGGVTYDMPTAPVTPTDRFTRLTIVRDGATFAAYVNGLPVALSLATANTFDATVGTEASWLIAGFAGSQAFFSGTMTAPRLLNRALSAAEVSQMVQSGALLPVDRLGGSAANQVAGNSTGTNVGVVVSGNCTDATGASYVGTTTGQMFANINTSGGANYILRPGQRYSITLDAIVNSGVALKLYLPGNANNGPDLTTGSHAFSFVCSGQTGLFAWVQSAGLSVDSVLKNVRVRENGALIQPEITRSSQVLDHGPNRIRGLMTAGVRPLCSRDPEPVDFTLTVTGAFVTGASTNPLWFEAGMVTHVYAMADTAGADITLRRNSSSTNNLVTALTDLPTANVWTPLTIIDAQRIFAAGETLWGAASVGTIRFRLFWTRN